MILSEKSATFWDHAFAWRLRRVAQLGRNALAHHAGAVAAMLAKPIEVW
jgi:hypothetical protein